MAMEQPAVTASLNASHSLVLCDLPGDCTQRRDRNKDPRGSPLAVFSLCFPVTATPFLGCMLHSVAIGVLSHVPSYFCPSAVLGGRGRQGSLLGEGGRAWLSHLPTPTPSYRGARPRLLLSWTFVLWPHPYFMPSSISGQLLEQPPHSRAFPLHGEGLLLRGAGMSGKLPGC